MVTALDYKSIPPAWCPGCGDFGVVNALKKTLVALEKEPNDILMCSGIGQAAKMPHYLKCNVFNGLHGNSRRLTREDTGFVHGRRDIFRPNTSFFSKIG